MFVRTYKIHILLHITPIIPASAADLSSSNRDRVKVGEG